MHCRSQLEREPNRLVAELDEDYYAAMARDERPITRLHTEELTGQTERDDAAARQARFQGIFLRERTASSRPESTSSRSRPRWRRASTSARCSLC